MTDAEAAASPARELPLRPMGARRRDRPARARRLDRRAGGERRFLRPRLRRRARSRARGRRPGAAQADLSRARRSAEGARAIPDRTQGGVLRALVRDRRDARRRLVDIEGGIGTLAFYASRGRRDLPNARVLLDGGVESLSKDDSFSAQHILTPLTGAAVHINAFNFPVLGHAGEARADSARRRPRHRQAREPDGLSDGADGPPHRRIRPPAARRAATDLRRRRRSVRPPDRPGRRHLHRLRADRAAAAQPSRHRRANPCASRWRPTASTPPSSAPTPRPARRSSTCSSKRSCAR